MASAIDEPLLTTTEVAALLQVHPKRVYRLLRDGLPGKRLGGEWRFHRAAVLAWVSGREETASPAAAHDETSTPRHGASVIHRAPPFLAANGDVAVERLLALVNAGGAPILGFVQSDRERALRLLEEGAVLAAGCHGKGPPARLGDLRVARIHLVTREVGLVARTRKVPVLADLAHLRFGSRPASAGIVAHLDGAIAREKLNRKKILAGAVPFDSHRDVVFAVLRGEVDVGLATRAWASRLGLGFRALATERYGLLVRAEELGEAAVVRLCEVAQSEEFRRSVSATPGYDVSGSGDIRYDREPTGNTIEAASPD